jgi:hypothetical protein
VPTSARVACVDGGGGSRGAQCIGLIAPRTWRFVAATAASVVLVARAPETCADERFVADLVALAHVVVLTARIGRGAGRRARLGAARRPGVRLLWPLWRSSDPPEHRPSWRAEGWPVRRALVPGGGDPGRPRRRAATLRVEGDPCRSVGPQPGHLDQQERRLELESLRSAVAGDRAAAEELISEYQSELTRSDEQVYQLEQSLERERELRQRFEQGYLTLATGDPAPTAAATNGTLGEVVRRAKADVTISCFCPKPSGPRPSGATTGWISSRGISNGSTRSRPIGPPVHCASTSALRVAIGVWTGCAT